MRGLTVFISDIRACKSSEAEEKRVNKELANIRQKFGEKKGLDGYQKKKYVCKLLFIFLLGHEVDFGHLEAVNLLTSNTFSEKQMGYLFISVLLTENSELSRLIIQSCKADLASPNELFVCLALHCIANVGGKEMASAVSPEVQRLLVASESPFTVKKKAALCLLRFARKAPDMLPRGDFTHRAIEQISSPDLGVVTSVASLVLSLAAHNPQEYHAALHIAINRLHRVLMTPGEESYTFYGVRAPWLVVKLLRIMQVFPFPTDPSVAERLKECLSKILTNSQRTFPESGQPQRTPKSNFYNAHNACFFEMVNLVSTYDNDRDLLVKIATQLGNYLGHKEVNMRYLALEGLAIVAQTTLARDAARKHQPTVLRLLKSEKDTTVQQRAVDVLYAICDTASVAAIVKELLEFLETADYALREDLVLKIALLAERFVSDYAWFVDVMLKLLRVAGDYVADEVWHRLVQIITNRLDVQDYAAKTCFEALLNPASHETMVMVGACVLGEFGHLIANDPNSSPTKQLQVLQSHYPLLSAPARAQLLSTYIKLSNLFPELRTQVQLVFQNPNLLRSGDAEIQQRANEYLNLTLLANQAVMPAVLEEMPPYAERESSILAKLDSKLRDVADETGPKRRAAKALAQVTSAAVAAAAPAPPPAAKATIANAEGFERFALLNAGVLYENPVLQIGVKAEYSHNMGRITIFFGNRSASAVTGLSARAYMAESPSALRIQQKPMDPTVPPGVQLQLHLQVECVSPFAEPPLMDVSLTYQTRSVLLTLKLPIFVNKFLTPLPTPLSSDEFFAKWNQLGGPPREVRHIVKAKEPVQSDAMRQKVKDFGLQVLEGIDPNPDNAVCAGILHTTSGQMGALLRCEPNASAQMYRFTLRMSNDLAALHCCNLLASLF